MSETGRNAIVVGFDFSEASRQAVWWAAHEAGGQHRPLLLVHAFAWPFEELTRVYVRAHGEETEPLQQAIRRELEVLAEGCHQIAPDLRVRNELRSGDPVDVLGEAAEAAALLVVGASGLGGPHRAHAGSTSAELLSRRSGSPVVVVRDDSLPGSGHVVVGVDGSSASTRAIGFAYDFAARHGSELVAVHAWSDLPLDPFARVQKWELDMGEVRDSASELLAESLAGWAERYPDVVVRRVVTPERPADALFDEARGACMLVVGSHGRGPVRRTLLGSVSHAAVNRAPCPVAVLPAEQ